MGLIKSAMADAAITSMFVFTLPFVPLLSSIVSKSLGMDPKSLSLPNLFITITLVAMIMLLFGTLAGALGGASFNPAAALCFAAAGLRKPSAGEPSVIIRSAGRLPAQAGGAVIGALAVVKVMPVEYQSLLRGPVLSVDLLTGAIVEGILTFVQCLYLLVVMVKGPKLPILKTWLMAATTIGLFMIGSGLTGPGMNPAIAFGWAYAKNRHNTWELYSVYWVGPLVGSIFAGRVFGLFFTEPVKVKKA
ncbi:PREDICTED: aquaporin SIP1-1-like [Tarenaya hassleriana]|uniref:aquaporin SIP1-1-like n=1 Tax=Tarenaya hassleriana TaxID=28532 RepID=UPI00053CA97E|nr:PREDICTED: aquaporin SIP1-1-like [Tarenaya hassleriana]